MWCTISDSTNNGTFYATASNPGTIISKAQEFLDDADGYTGPNRWMITELKADVDARQDMGTATAVPLPAAAWLLLGVSGALVGAKRRKRRVAAA